MGIIKNHSILKKFDADENKFDQMQLRGRRMMRTSAKTNSIDWDSDAAELVEGAVAYLTKRFACFREEPFHGIQLQNMVYIYIYIYIFIYNIYLRTYIYGAINMDTHGWGWQLKHWHLVAQGQLQGFGICRTL